MRSTLKNKRIKTREPINTGESEVVFYRNILGVHYIEKRPQESHWPIENEARILKRLKHNWTPKYVDSHLEREVNKSSPFIKMREIKGKTLEQIFQDSRLDLQDIIAYLRQLSFYLCCLHQDDRIWHLDLKPPNIIISNLGRIHLIDFGSACLTEQNKVIGEYRRRFTSGYSAPELQKDSLSPCFQSDLYSLGMIGVKLLTRKEPHEIEEELKRKKQHIDQGWCEYIHPDYRQKGNIDSDLSELISQLIARSPEARAKSTDEIYREFNRIQECKLTSTYYSKEFRLSASLLLSSSLFLSARFIGVLEIPELYAYDYLYKVKALIAPDETAQEIVVVTIDDEDVNLQTSQEIGSPTEDEDSISDQSLFQLLEILVQNNPRVIGIDLKRRYNNYPKEDREYLHAFLAKTMYGRDFYPSIIGTCHNYDETTTEIVSSKPYEPPDEYMPAFTKPNSLNTDQYGSLKYLGYVDLFEQNKVETVRRYLNYHIAKPSRKTEICSKYVNHSFAFRVATSYLNDFDISYNYQTRNYNRRQCPNLSPPEDGLSDYIDFIFKEGENVIALFPGLTCRFGGKLLGNQDGGHQMMLQYRAVKYRSSDFSTVSLREIIQSPEAVAKSISDKIVLIGVERQGDKHTTPLGEKHGVFIHAHAVSQIIDVAHHRRKLIWAFPLLTESVMIFALGLLSMPFLKEHKHSSVQHCLIGNAVFPVSIAAYFIVFSYYSLWIPIIPIILVSFTSNSLFYLLTSNVYYTRYWLIYSSN